MIGTTVVFLWEVKRRKRDYKRTLLVGLAFLSICAFWQLYDSVVPLILKNTFDMPDDIAGVIMALDNILALFLLPLFGKLSDRTRTPLGKRMPYIVGGTLAAAVLDLLAALPDGARAFLHVNGFVAFCKESLPLFGIGLFWLIPAVAGLVIGFILRAAGKKATA